jgi:hypothetical protein
LFCHGETSFGSLVLHSVRFARTVSAAGMVSLQRLSRTDFSAGLHHGSIENAFTLVQIQGEGISKIFRFEASGFIATDSTAASRVHLESKNTAALRQL